MCAKPLHNILLEIEAGAISGRKFNAGVDGIEVEPQFITDAVFRQLVVLARRALREADPLEYSDIDYGHVPGDPPLG